VFYYAGHGTQVAGRNYLIPVDANLFSNESLKKEAFNLDYLLNGLNSINSNANIIILDACRNMPFSQLASNSLTRSLGLSNSRGVIAKLEEELSSGLSQLVAPDNTLISFSTAPGTVAEDGYGDNSNFTKALAREISNLNSYDKCMTSGRS
jgi:uncharacterized caspase-like protein